jgi:TonB family protein
MRHIGRILPVSSLAALLVLLPLRAQNTGGDTGGVDGAIEAARSAGKPELLEESAAKLEGLFQYDAAKKLLDAALSLRGQVNGDQSAEYGLCLLKLGTLERKTGLTKEAAVHYAKAVHLLPGRSETAPVYLYLGIAASGMKSPALENENLQKARNLDISLTGPVLMWTALLHERQDELEAAEANYKAALAAENADSIETFETLTLYGRFLQQHGRDSEAQAIQARAAAIRSAHPSQPKTSTPPSGSPHPHSITPASDVYKVGGGVHSPTVISKTEPQYSEEARVAKYSATVLLQVTVGTDGAPHDIKVMKAAGFGLDDCAISTIARWRFKPAQKDGDPVPVYATIEVNFRLL